MTHVTCRLTAKNRDQLRNPTLGNRAWADLFLITSRNWRKIHTRENAGEVEHLGDEERQVGYDDDDHRLHDAEVMREARREAAGETHQRPYQHRPDDHHRERHDAEHDVGSNDTVGADIAELAEHVIEHLQTGVKTRLQR